MVILNRLQYFVLCLYVALLPFIPSTSNLKYVHAIPDMILFVFVLIFILKILIDKSFLYKFKHDLGDFFKDYLGISLIILLAIMFISTVYAYDKKIAISESLRFLSYIILFFIIKYDIKEKKSIMGIINIYILGILIISIYGIVQQFTGFGLGENFIYRSTQGIIKQRIFSFLENPNSLGAYLVVGLFPLIMVMLQEKKLIKKVYLIAVSVLMLATIYLSYSRNAWIAVAVGFIVISLFYSWKVLLASGVLGVSLLLVPQISTRLESVLTVSANSDRVHLWKVALKMIKEHPIFGVGNGNYVSLYDNYVHRFPELKYSNFTHYPSHNSFLKVESELGIAGGLSFISVLFFSAKKILNVIKYCKDSYFVKFYTGFFASVMAFYFMNLSDNLFFVPKTASFFWIFLAFGDNLLQKSKK